MNRLCTLLAKSWNKIWVYNSNLNEGFLFSAQARFKTNWLWGKQI